jgi:L-asparaginase
MRRILFVFTGGTISMRLDAGGVAVPALSGQEVLALVPDATRLCEPVILDYGRFPGPHITPARMWELQERIASALESGGIDGVVVTHGTDTLEETAYFLDCLHPFPQPVVLTGAMRNSSELGFDGPANLRAAIRVAADPASAGRGVMVVMNDLIHAAAEVTKNDTQAVDTFVSPVYGALGIADADRILYTRSQAQHRPIPAAGFETLVYLVSACAGSDATLLDAATAAGAKGIVIAGTGRGNVPPAMLPGIDRALAEGVAVVIASRCRQGRVLDTYGYEGSGRDLRRRGVILSGLLSPAKARIRLMLALRAPGGVSSWMDPGPAVEA